jgi:metallo-beta-lactamase family protein
MSLIKIGKSGRAKRILYTGDVGRFNTPILRDPCLNFAAADREIDILIMESTYGNRVHGPAEDIKGKLGEVLTETFERDGAVLIPAFAFGRTQTLLYLVHELFNDGAVKRVPVYVDSPLANNLTKVFVDHPEVYDENTHKVFLRQSRNPFQFPEVKFVSSVEDSMAVNRQEGPQVVLAASGMCEAGRILHHLRWKVHNHRNTILLVGYMAQHTLGYRIETQGLAYEEAGRKSEPPVLRFLNKEYPLKAHVRKIDGLSAHADRDEMVRFLKESNLQIKKIVLVHGEEEQSLPFAQTLKQQGYDVFVPGSGDTVDVN